MRHAGQRVQFGRPIGAFQAVQAPAGRRGDRPGVRPPAARRGARAARPGPALADAADGAARDISAAKVACADAAHRAARTALQVHGAIGYTWEHDLGLWLTKVRALIPAWGTQAEHRARGHGRADRTRAGVELTAEQPALRDAVRGLLTAGTRRPCPARAIARLTPRRRHTSADG